MGVKKNLKKSFIFNKLLIAFLLITFSLTVNSPLIFSQDKDEPINPDRPDQNESPEVIEPLTLQFESGFVYEKTADSPDYKETNLSIPQTLIRFGVLKFVEFRTYLEYHETKDEFPLNPILQSPDKTYWGLLPVKLGIKLKFHEGEKLIPTAALLINLTFPKLAGKNYTADYLAPEVNLSLEHNLSNKITVGYNMKMFWDGVSTLVNEYYSISANYNITKRLTTFLETYAFYQNGVSADNRLDAGFTFLTSNDTQVDIAGGIGFSYISPKYYICCGFSFRFPKLLLK